MCKLGTSLCYAVLQWNGLQSCGPQTTLGEEDPSAPLAHAVPPASDALPSPDLLTLTDSAPLHLHWKPPCLPGWAALCHPTVIHTSDLGVRGEVSLPPREELEGRTMLPSLTIKPFILQLYQIIQRDLEWPLLSFLQR